MWKMLLCALFSLTASLYGTGPQADETESSFDDDEEDVYDDEDEDVIFIEESEEETEEPSSED